MTNVSLRLSSIVLTNDRQKNSDSIGKNDRHRPMKRSDTSRRSPAASRKPSVSRAAAANGPVLLLLLLLSPKAADDAADLHAVRLLLLL
jgi:hypothetical protein